MTISDAYREAYGATLLRAAEEGWLDYEVVESWELRAPVPLGDEYEGFVAALDDIMRHRHIGPYELHGVPAEWVEA